MQHTRFFHSHPACAALILAVLLCTPVHAQHHTHGDRIVDFPDVPGYLTLSADLHLHTVFSDGSVWPNIRVEEAVRDGLDAIAVTDHIEYQPHKDDIPHPDRNRSYDVAVDAGEGTDLMIFRGSEITRSMPPGHSNAVFLQDANALLVDDPMDAFRAAEAQGAFIFWNHPMWERQVPSGVATLTDMHRDLIREGLLHGIEVVNADTYSDEALQIALDHDLTILGTSDIHGLVDWQFEVPHGGHRPLTLVFTRERSEESVKEALFAGRTVVWFEDLLVGRAEHLMPLLEASILVEDPEYEEETTILAVTLQNQSDARFLLDNRSGFTFQENADVVTLEPNGTLALRIKTLERLGDVGLEFEVLNAVTAPDEHPVISLQIAVP